MKRIIKWCIKHICKIFNVFYVPFLKRYILKELALLPKTTQAFFLTRSDLGPIITVCYYVRCWNEERGSSCVIVLTPLLDQALSLLKYVSPHSKVIAPQGRLIRWAVWLMGKKIMRDTFFSVYGSILARYPNILRVFDFSSRSEYIPELDPILKKNKIPLSKTFLNAYQDARRRIDFVENIYYDTFQLHYNQGLVRKNLCSEALVSIQQKLKITKPFILLNVNSKLVKYPSGINRRIVSNPKRYNVIIDFLISKGFLVVMQGRKEQYPFEKRSGLINYAHSEFATIENDIALFAGAQCAIMNKTGPDLLALICNTPLLGLDYAELAAMIPSAKLRFYPKKIKKKGKAINWQELLSSPSFYDIGTVNYDEEIEYHELEEKELLAAVEEFLPLALRDEKWFDYSEEQKEFRKHLNPLHLDLFHTQAVPCNCYLNS